MLGVRLVRVLSGACLLTACGRAGSPGAAESPTPTPAAATPAAKKGPVDFAALEAREADAQKPLPFASKDGSLHGTIEGNAPPKVSYHEGFMEVAASIGSETPVDCMVYDQDIRVGASLSSVLASITQQGKATLVKIGVDSVEAMGDAGGVYATGIYQTVQNGQQAVGSLKIFLHGSLEHGVMCLHDEVGYRKTFARVTRGLVESLKFPSQFNKPRLVEIVRFKIGEQPVGYSQSTVVDMPNGVRLSISASSRLLPVAAAEVSTSDSLSILGLDAEHRIVTGKYSEHEGATESLVLDLTRADKNRYHYEGKAHQKPLTGEFTTKDKKGLLASIARDLQIAELARDKKSKVLKLEEYSPDSDPTRTETVSANVNGAARRVKLTWGGVTVEEQLGDDGFAVSGQAQLGKITLSLDRLVRNGQL